MASAEVLTSDDPVRLSQRPHAFNYGVYLKSVYEALCSYRYAADQGVLGYVLKPWGLMFKLEVFSSPQTENTAF